MSYIILAVSAVALIRLAIMWTYPRRIDWDYQIPRGASTTRERTRGN